MKNSRENTISGYLYSMDCLRAISLILIFIFHNWQASWITYRIAILPGKYLINLELFQRYGYIAIDSFFVLSGFGLFYPIAREMFGESEHKTWKEFYLKRARRILPAYYLILIIMMFFPVLSYNIYDSHSIADIVKHFGTHFTFTHIYNNATQGSTISTAWTLGIEVAFYAVFPLIVKLFKKKPLASFIGMFIIGQITRIILLTKFDITNLAVSSFPLAYIDIFGWGMISAYYVVKLRHCSKKICKIQWLMTLLSILSMVAVYWFVKWMSLYQNGILDKYRTDYATVFRFLYRFILDGAFALFLFATPFSLKVWGKNICGNKLFRYLSTISYSFFLWHQNIQIFLKKINIPYTNMNPPMNDREAMESFTVLVILISLSLATLSTYLLENPICKYGFKGYIKNICGFIGKKIKITKKHRTVKTHD